MNRKSLILLHASFFILNLLFLSGCSDGVAKSPAHGHGHEESHGGEVEFSPGKGLKVSELARTTMGIQTAEVTPSKAGASKRWTAHVFRLPNEPAGKYYRSGFAYASMPVPAADAKGLKPGLRLVLSSADGQGHPSVIQRLDRQMEEINGQTEVILEIQQASSSLTINAAFEAVCQVSGELEESQLVPKSAVLDTAKGSFVYVENAGFFLRTPVKAQASEDGTVRVLDGLFEGDVVVTEGAQGLYLTELQAVNAGTGCTHGH